MDQENGFPALRIKNQKKKLKEIEVFNTQYIKTKAGTKF